MRFTAMFFCICLSPFGLNAQTILPYSQDFEGSTFLPGGWEAFGSNMNAAWEHSSTVGAYGKSSMSAFFDNFSGNLAGNYYGMRAVALDLTNAVKPALRFDVAYAKRSGSNSDYLGIWYSYNGTTNWKNWVIYQDGDLATAPDQSSYFTPTPTQWDSITIDLSFFAGTPYIRFAFENNCQNGNVMYIDNVRFFDADFTGISTVEKHKNYPVIYPNPVSEGKFDINAFGRHLEAVQISDMMGKSVKADLTPVFNGKYEIDVKNHSPGVYLISMFGMNGEIFHQRLIFE